MVECQLPKLNVAGSIPVSRSIYPPPRLFTADVVSLRTEGRWRTSDGGPCGAYPSRFARRSRRLLATTLTELNAMAALASTGLSSTPNHG